MKVKVPGWAAVPLPGGGIISNEVVDVDDSDADLVAFWKRIVADGSAELVEASHRPKAQSGTETPPKRRPGRPRKQTAT